MSESEHKSYISDELSDTTKDCAESCGRLADSMDDTIFSLEEMLAIAGEVWKLTDSAAWMDRYIYDRDVRQKKKEQNDV